MISNLIMMAVITNSYANVSSSFYGAKFGRSVEELMVSPMQANVILLGYMTGGMLRSVLVGVLVAIVSMWFTHFHIHNIIQTT